MEEGSLEHTDVCSGREEVVEGFVVQGAPLRCLSGFQKVKGCLDVGDPCARVLSKESILRVFPKP